jgi:hypothetical protein
LVVYVTTFFVYSFDLICGCTFVNQHAIAYAEGEKFFGAKATINVWEPKIQQTNEFSLSQLWVLGGSFGQDLNSIEAGWQVLQSRYQNQSPVFDFNIFVILVFIANSNVSASA